MINKLLSWLTPGESTGGRVKTPKDIYEFVKARPNAALTGGEFEKLKEYCFSDEMQHSGEKVPQHVHDMFPGRRIVTTMHIKRKSSPLLANAPSVATTN